MMRAFEMCDAAFKRAKQAERTQAGSSAQTIVLYLYSTSYLDLPQYSDRQLIDYDLSVWSFAKL
jgi:hypothetical protein